MSIDVKKLKLNVAEDLGPRENAKLTVGFLHGIAADASSFWKTIAAIHGEEKFSEVRLVSFDLLGAGESLSSGELEYNYEEQLAALSNSLSDLGISGPLVLVGHSMGTLIATRFAAKNPGTVRELILVSPPIYTPEDIKNPLFEKAMAGFRAVVAGKNPEVAETKAFNNEISNIVSDPENYRYLAETKVPTSLIYGDADEIIASFNLPKVLKANPRIRAIRTIGTHGISSVKIAEIKRELERILSEVI